MRMKRQQRNAWVIGTVLLIAVYSWTSQSPPPSTPDATPTVAISVAPVAENQSALFAHKRIEHNTKFDSPLKLTQYLNLIRDIPKDRLPHDRVATKLEELRGLVALDDIEKNEPILLSRFARPEEIGRLSQHLAEGMRAMTLRVDKVHAVGGFITQGDLVDVLGSFSVDGQVLTKYILNRVKILA